jgi:hypothetical protein
MVKTELKCVISTFFTSFVQSSPRVPNELSSWAGATHEPLWAQNRVQEWSRSSPTRSHSAAILTILPCATSSPVGTCRIAKVNARVNDMVICVFHVPVTLPCCKSTIETR